MTDQPSRATRRSVVINFSCADPVILTWIDDQPNKSEGIREAILFSVINKEARRAERRRMMKHIERQHAIVNHYREAGGMSAIPLDWGSIL